MKEDLIVFIWKHQYFQKKLLKTSQNEKLQILKTGEENLNSGPDFFNAQVIIDKQHWAGNVEIHVKSSDWYVHGHETDANYDNVILHVVWEDDVPVFRKDNSHLSTLELSNFVDEELFDKYLRLFSKERKWINCEQQIASTDKFLRDNWTERLYFERLESKSKIIQSLLNGSSNDWEAVLFQMLAKNFGLKVNGTAFFEFAKNIDFSIIRKEGSDLNKLEALLFGSSGLLDKEIENEYFQLLKENYVYQLKKYRLSQIRTIPVQFFRLRPNNFPTIRLAQLAKLYHHYQNLFSNIIETETLDDYYKLFAVTASSFWDTHYTFETTSKKRSKKLTKAFIDLLLINTVIPIKFIYQKSIGKENEEEIIKLITGIKPERNAIIEKFAALNIHSNSALYSQSLIQLKNEYCKKHACLTCQIGADILKK